MKSLKLLIATALVAMPSVPALSAPNGNFGQIVQQLSDFCQNVVLPAIPQANFGECVSYGLTFGTYGYAQHECDAERETNPDFDIDFGTYANCVHLLHGDTV